MKYSVVDIGSNSIRLTVYKVKDGRFRILFKEKRMLGLAGYVEDGCINEQGIARAIQGLSEFRAILDSLGIKSNIYVFATASLRNIANTDEAEARIEAATGLAIDVITGEEEALLGYTGVMQEISAKSGVFVDIGGGSTETAVFSGGEPRMLRSYREGSLKLYKECVEGILPGKSGVKRINAAIKREFGKQPLQNDKGNAGKNRALICTGGTARSILKFVRYMDRDAAESRIVTVKQFERLGALFLGDRKKAADIILRVDPERIHTIIPGYLIMKYIVQRFGIKEMTVGSYGVREGYLCQRILKQKLK